MSFRISVDVDNFQKLVRKFLFGCFFFGFVLFFGFLFGCFLFLFFGVC